MDRGHPVGRHPRTFFMQQKHPTEAQIDNTKRDAPVATRTPVDKAEPGVAGSTVDTGNGRVTGGSMGAQGGKAAMGNRDTGRQTAGTTQAAIREQAKADIIEQQQDMKRQQYNE